MREGPAPARRLRSILLIALITVCVIAAIHVFARAATILTVRQRQTRDQTDYSFNPGMIVSDRKFFDSNALSEADVQGFLNREGAACTGQSCLKNATFPVRTVRGSGRCTGYAPDPTDRKDQSGQPLESAARIIDHTAHSCAISQRTLLVMLEKEEGLVRTSNPTSTRYRTAMGLSCPDTSACDARYFGFFNQVYGAASRLQYYRDHPDSYRYKARNLNRIQYHPNTACGTSQVYIENTATALLYIYTPYQPDQAALTGHGDICSSWGNLNFSRLWTAWFGSPR